MTQSGVGVFIYRCGEYLCLSHEARSGRELPRLSAPPSFVFHVVTGRVLCALWPHLLQVQAAEGELGGGLAGQSGKPCLRCGAPGASALSGAGGSGSDAEPSIHGGAGGLVSGPREWCHMVSKAPSGFKRPTSKICIVYIYIYIYTRRCLNHI